MNIYKISQVMIEDNVIYDSGVICANTEEEALKLYPYPLHSKVQIRPGRNNQSFFCESRADIEIELISKVNDNIKEGIILTNCNVK